MRDQALRNERMPAMEGAGRAHKAAGQHEAEKAQKGQGRWGNAATHTRGAAQPSEMD